MKRFRKERIGSLVRDIVAESVQRKMNDPRVSPLTTVTRVEMSADLLYAKVYFSVHGDESAERRTLAAIRHASGFLQTQVARGLSIRQCPELQFDIDEQPKKVRRMMGLLEELREVPDGDGDRAAADAPPDSYGQTEGGTDPGDGVTGEHGRADG